MAINNEKRGFALLIAVIFMSVMLSFGLALSSLGYKQLVLASTAVESQYAFYAADAALECALYADQQQNLFDHASHDATPGGHPSAFVCDGTVAAEISYSWNANLLKISERLDLDAGTSRPRCAVVTVYKYASPQPPDSITTFLFSQGYDVSCATVDSPGDARFVSRGIQAHY